MHTILSQKAMSGTSSCYEKLECAPSSQDVGIMSKVT